MTDPVLYQKMQMHARLQGGSLYVYDILDEAKKSVGTYSITTRRKKGVATRTTTYRLKGRDDDFETREAFVRAYVQSIRDAEFDAAAPKTP